MAGLFSNPANRKITDVLQGQEGTGGFLGNPIFEFGANTTGSAANTVKRASAPSPQVLGASDPGFMYYDASSGGVVSSDNLNASGNPIFDANGNRLNYNAGATDRTTTPAPDPYAKFGGKQAYDNLVNSTNIGRQNILDTSMGQVNSAETTGRNSILDMLDSIRSGQQSIDMGRANVELSRSRGADDIMGMVGRGIANTGVRLANKNSASSSATGRAAQIYGDIGNREMGNVNNQAELANQELDVQQGALNTDISSKQRAWDKFKQDQISSIVDTARASLAALDAEAQGAGLGKLFEVEAEKQRVKDALMGKLTQLDTELTQGRSQINPMAREQVLARSNEMKQAGSTAPQMFNFNTTAAVPGQTVNPMGDVAGATLPIYSNLRRRGV